MKSSNAALLEHLTTGWQAKGESSSSMTELPPMTVTWGTGANVTGSGASVNAGYPDRVACSSLINPGNVSHYVNTSCFTLPMAPSMAYWTANCDQTTGVYGSAKTVEPYPVCFNLRGNSRTEPPQWSRSCDQLGHVLLQKQLHPEDFRKLQRPVEIRSFQHSQSRQFPAAWHSRGNHFFNRYLQWERSSDYHVWTAQPG